ncbi:hypothetical protein, partial [Cryobacterium sp. 5B3]|uniref:hypothetical protein n=1 Tax=Cryobacterium sp. 5B3 TaxID=3048586 RepID=UPI002B236145
MSASSAVPATPAGFEFPSVENDSAACTWSTADAVTLQFPAASRTRTVNVRGPSLNPRASIVDDTVHGPVPVTVIAVPLPAPGSAPENHSA